MKIKTKTGIKGLIGKLAPLLALAILCIILTVVTDKFLVKSNLMNVLRQASVNSLISAGMLVVLITAGIDLSVGSNLALAICVMAVLKQGSIRSWQFSQNGVQNSVILILACLFAGALAGMFNGLLLTKLKLPHPFVSTLGTKNIMRGLALFITAATPIAKFPKPVVFLGETSVSGFPVSFVLVIVIFIAFDLFLNRTALGRQIYCVGGNAEAARLSGINSDRVLTTVYVISGLMCALAGIVMVGRVNSVAPTAADLADTDAIASCIIGGASFSGGKGTIWGTLIGSLLIAVIRNGLNLLGASSEIQLIIIGGVIILSVFIDVTRLRLEERSRRMAAI